MFLNRRKVPYAISRNGDIALLIHNPDTKQRSAVSFMPWEFYETLVFTKKEARWGPEPAWIPQTRW